MMLLFLLTAAASVNGCYVIDHDRILGRDLAIAAPALAALAPDSSYGPAPQAGNRRIFDARELRRIAAQNSIEADFADSVCFAWATKPLERDLVVQAITKTLAARNVRIEILDQSSWPVPEGEISFPKSSMSLGSGGVALWRGYVRYADTRRLEIWARVRITVWENHLIAAEKLVSGERLSATQLRSESYDGAFTREEPITSADQAIGLIPKFDIAAGTVLMRQMLDIPHDVERGDTVAVVSAIGRARVEASCIAEESGRAGSVIAVHNARSGRRLRVVIQGKGKAVIVSADALGLLAQDIHR